MKEFLAQTGGRYTYSDDFLNLQDLALSSSAVFKDCGDMILSGCALEDGKLTAGYVYLNGKIRSVPETSVSGSRAYIYESNHYENIDYVTGDTKVGRVVYGVRVESSALSGITDPVTEGAPRYVVSSADNDYTLALKFFGRYALSTDPKMGPQVVPNNVNFAGRTTLTGQVMFRSTINLGLMAGVNTLASSGNSVTLRTLNATPGDTKFIFGGNNLLTINNGGSDLFKLTTGGLQFTGGLSVASSTIGNITVRDNNIYQGATDGTATLNINMRGFGGDVNQFRNTVIGNGKGKAVLSVNGGSGVIEMAATANVLGGILNLYEGEGSGARMSGIRLRSFDGTVLSVIGYNGDVDNVLKIKATNHPVEINASYLNVIGGIKEDGTSLSEKYTLKSELNAAVASLVPVTRVYSKTESDARYGLQTGGLSQFVKGANTKDQLRSQIGAAATSDLNRYCRKDAYLADMATTEEEKAAIRNVIGACGPGDFQAKLGDTGWLEGSSPFGGYVKSRQIGSMVFTYVKYTLPMTVYPAEETMFNLPNGVPAPICDMMVQVTTNVTAKITAGSRIAKLVNKTTYQATGDLRTVIINFSYMV